MKEQIYISGKITGYTTEEAEAKFAKTTKFIEGFHGNAFKPVSPFDLSVTDPRKTWKDYMVDDIKGLLDCQAICLQSDWAESKGARLELAVAESLGLTVYKEINGKLLKQNEKLVLR